MAGNGDGRRTAGPDFTTEAFRVRVQKTQQSKDLTSFYCREDFLQALAAAARAKGSRRQAVLRELEELCASRGMTIRQLRDDRQLLDEVPDRAQVRQALLEMLYQAYTDCPGPEQVMGRIVDRLVPGDDSTRLKILKRFVAGCGAGCRTVDAGYAMAWAAARMGPAQRAAYDRAPDGEKPALAAAWLTDEIFSEKPGQLTRREQLRLMADKLALLAGDQRVTDAAGKACPFPPMPVTEGLRDFCRERRIPIGGDDALPVMGKLAAMELSDEALEPLFATLPQAFEQHMKGTYYRDRKGEVTPCWSLYRDSLKAAKKAVRKRPAENGELLALCDDLAAGRFRPGGRTRVRLYWFAMVFGMTAALLPGEGPNESTDLEKNLFYDYHADNMLRYLRQEGSSDVEAEPAGDGINCKNFQEALYLYYLRRTDLPLSPGQRIDRAVEHAGRCLALAAERGNEAALDPGRADRRTEVYRAGMEQLLRCSEEELDGYILKNYHLALTAGQRPIQAADWTNTAYDIMDQLMVQLDELEDPVSEMIGMYHYNGLGPEDGDRASAWADMQLAGAGWSDHELYRLLEERYGRTDGPFMEIARRLDERLNADMRWEGSQRAELLVHVLRALLRDGGTGLRTLIKSLRERLVYVDGDALVRSAELLCALGLEVLGLEKDDEPGERRSERRLALGRRTGYEDGRLDELIELTEASDDYDMSRQEQQACRIAGQLLGEKRPAQRRLTRAKLLAACARVYLAQLQQGEQVMDDEWLGTSEEQAGTFIKTFPAVYKDFHEFADPKLVQARFQPLSEKNLMDMYVLVSVYLALVDKNQELA